MFAGCKQNRQKGITHATTQRRNENQGLVQEQCRKQATPCLHVGLAADYCEIIWDEHYRVSADTAADICDYPLARNLVLLAVAIASETVMAFALEGVREDWSATLRDLAIRSLDV